MAHPQSSPRGNVAHKRIEIGTDGTAVLTTNSTGTLLISKGIAIGGETADTIDQNSTALLLSAGLALSGETTDIITQNSTSVNFAGGIKVSGQANGVMTALSTGVVLTAIKLGTFWLEANSTGLTIGGAQVSTA